MGLLDDAIREHLDLKRRRGADPAEVERAEQEALGPVRRGPIEAEPPELVLDEAHQPAWDDEYEGEPEAADATGAVPFAEPDVPLEPRPGVASDMLDEDDPFDEQRYAEPEYLEADPERAQAHDPLDEPGPPPHRAPLPREQFGETVEYDVEEALDERTGQAAPPTRPPAQKPPAGTEEDPLEETPEFLQETPDHDRLWFEQRPPRDFDFDG